MIGVLSPFELVLMIDMAVSILVPPASLVNSGKRENAERGTIVLISMSKATCLPRPLAAVLLLYTCAS